MGQPGAIGPDVVPALDPAVDLLAAGDHIVSFRGAADAALIEELAPEDLRAILARVDGVATAGAIAASLAADYEADSVLAVLGALIGRGLRIAAEDPRRVPAGASILILGDGRLAVTVAAELAGAERLGVAGFASCADPRFLEAERDRRLTPPSPAGSAPPVDLDQLASFMRGRDLVIAALEDVPFAAALDVTRAALATEVPVLFALAAGDGAVVLGPTMVPWKSPCFACSRLGAALRVAPPAVAIDLLPHLRAGRIGEDAPAFLLPLAADEVRREVSAFFTARYPRFLHQLLTLGPDGQRATEEVEPTTECPLCHGMNRRAITRGRPAAPPDRHLAWTRRAVVERVSGLRSVGPEEARRRAEAAMEALGVRIEMEPAPDDAPGWALASGCAYFQVRRQPIFDPSRPWLVRERTPPAYGKGTSAVQAWCSAAFEWFERESMSYSGDVEVVRAPYRSVRDLALDVPRYLAGLVAGLDRGASFDPDADLDWVWGTCLRRRRPLLVPAAATYVFNGRFRGSDIHWPRRGSSGQAAGCTLEDALLEGLLEVVEHDAWFTAYRTGVPLPLVDLATVDDPVSRGIIERLEAAGSRLQVRDVTNELGVPVLEVYVLNESDPRRCFAGGRGAHLDPRIALRRALSEAMQGVYAVAPSRDDPHPATSLYARFPHAKHLIGRVSGRRALAEVPDLSAGLDAGGAVDRVVELVAAALPDDDLCFVDRSRPELPGVHVVSVIAGGVLDEVTLAAAHIPERVRRLAAVEEMFLGRCD